jgi:hypothetical protein
MKCRKCGEELTTECFYKNCNVCKNCIKKRSREWYFSNIERAKRVRGVYRKNNKEKLRETNKKWLKENKDRYNKHRRIYLRNKRISDKQYRIKRVTSTLLWRYLKRREIPKKSKTEDILGFSIGELISHLEKRFDNKMNWDNYGSYWHIDHIIPDSCFNYSSVNDLDFGKSWSLDNLQPLSAVDNLRKNNKNGIKVTCDEGI